MTAKVEWVNEAEWRQAVVDDLSQWRTEFEGNLEKLAEIAEREAKLRAPVRTGRLRNGIKGSASEDTLILGTDVPYAVYVEFGTRYTRAQPHMRPGMQAAIDQYERTMTQGLE